MYAAKVLHDEARRLETLHSLDLLDTEPEAPFQALVALAAQMFDCPVALLTLIDGDRQWVKAQTGDLQANVCRRDAICDHTIRGNTPLVVPDLRGDPRFTANPLVASLNGPRFYAGAPIHASVADDGPRAIGALCVIDYRPRAFDRAANEGLQRLATLAEALIAAREGTRSAVEIARERDKDAAEIARRDRTLRQAERIAQIGFWRYDIAEDQLEWSDGAYRIHALERRPLNVAEALDHYPPDARARVSAELVRTIETGTTLDIEEDFFTAAGERRRLHATAELERANGRPVAIVGVLQDVTERHALETRLRRAADTDALTGIANRAAFDRLLDEALGRHREAGTPLMLVLVDMDGFKLINDTFGHPAGDDVLRHCAAALCSPSLLGSVAARLGGDEFAVIVENADLCATPDRLRARLEEAMRLPVCTGGVTMLATGTVGVAAAGPQAQSAHDLVRNADADLYVSKRARVGDRRKATKAAV